MEADNESCEFYKYVDGKSILVITTANKLLRLYCPFAVKNNQGVVQKVHAICEKENRIYYKINGFYIPHNKVKII